jgi:TerC family integral membrane protein
MRHTSTAAWLVTIGVVAALFVLDLLVVGRRNRRSAPGRSLPWVLFYLGCAAVFALALSVLGNADVAREFVAGYATEYCLSVDNLFVFLLIMVRFSVPAVAQEKVLSLGILLSLLFRTLFILGGTALLDRLSWLFLLFAALLLYTAYGLLRSPGLDDVSFESYRAVEWLRRVVPLDDTCDGPRMVVRRGGSRRATPLLLVVASIGIANLVFALDSLPAIFGVSTDAYVIFTANAFALMGLRQLYFVVQTLLLRLRYLNMGLAVVLAFIAVKLFLEAFTFSGHGVVWGVHVPEIGSAVTLSVIGSVLLATTVASVARARRTPVG